MISVHASHGATAFLNCITGKWSHDKHLPGTPESDCRESPLIGVLDTFLLIHQTTCSCLQNSARIPHYLARNILPHLSEISRPVFTDSHSILIILPQYLSTVSFHLTLQSSANHSSHDPNCSPYEIHQTNIHLALLLSAHTAHLPSNFLNILPAK